MRTRAATFKHGPWATLNPARLSWERSYGTSLSPVIRRVAHTDPRPNAWSGGLYSPGRSLPLLDAIRGPMGRLRPNFCTMDPPKEWVQSHIGEESVMRMTIDHCNVPPADSHSGRHATQPMTVVGGRQCALPSPPCPDSVQHLLRTHGPRTHPSCRHQSRKSLYRMSYIKTSENLCQESYKTTRLNSCRPADTISEWGSEQLQLPPWDQTPSGPSPTVGVVSETEDREAFQK